MMYSTYDVSHVINLPGSPLSFPLFIRTGGEPGNEATSSTLVLWYKAGQHS